MDQTVHNPQVYDFRQYDRVWQRVAPTLEPFPGVNASMDTGAAGAEEAAPAPVPAPAGTQALTLAQESQLPGAFPDPCCMGTAAAEMLGVLTGYIEEELSDRWVFLTLSRRGPAWARQQLREIAAAQGAHARRLMAVHYLITGECYRPVITTQQGSVGAWCPALRERYHALVCTAMNYRRSAEETTDVCLSRLLDELSGEEYRQAEAVLSMLERSLKS